MTHKTCTNRTARLRIITDEIKKQTNEIVFKLSVSRLISIQFDWGPRGVFLDRMETPNYALVRISRPERFHDNRLNYRSYDKTNNVRVLRDSPNNIYVLTFGGGWRRRE